MYELAARVDQLQDRLHPLEVGVEEGTLAGSLHLAPSEPSIECLGRFQLSHLPLLGLRAGKAFWRKWRDLAIGRLMH